MSKITVFIVFELAISQLKLPAKSKQRYTNKIMKKAKYILKRRKKKQTKENIRPVRRP